jgi:nucleoside-diphosphate-sugar epimerase
MKRNQLFLQPDFLPEFEKFEEFTDSWFGITGKQGLVGGLVYERLYEAGIRVDAYPYDILNVQKLENWFQGKQFSHFFHFAGVVPVDRVENDPLHAFEVNAIGLFNLVKQIEKTQIDCWFFSSSSSHIYKPLGLNPDEKLTVNLESEPSNFYGKSKHVGELITRYLLENVSRPYCIGRIFSFTHLNQKGSYLVPTLIEKINMLKNGETLHLINPESVRDIMDLESVIDAILYIALKKYRGIINIGSGRGLSVREIAKLLIEKFKRDLRISGEKKYKPDSLVANVNELQRLVESVI